MGGQKVIRTTLLAQPFYPMTMLFKSAKGEESLGMKTMPECHFLGLSTPTVM